MDREFLDKLLEQISVSGCEECGQEVVKSHMQSFSDEIWTDEMGDVICILNPEVRLESCCLHMQMKLVFLSRGLQRKAEFRRLSVEVSFIRIIRDRSSDSYAKGDCVWCCRVQQGIV